jgi:hypothetical protein
MFIDRGSDLKAKFEQLFNNFSTTDLALRCPRIDLGSRGQRSLLRAGPMV